MYMYIPETMQLFVYYFEFLLRPTTVGNYCDGYVCLSGCLSGGRGQKF